MKRLLLSLAVLLPWAALQATPDLDSLCTQIGECLDDVNRLDEGRQLLDQAFSAKGVEQHELYPQLLYLQAYYSVSTGDMTQAKQQLLSLLPLLPCKANPELNISVPQDLGVCYRRESLNDSALYYYDLALQAAQEQHDLEWQATINLNIGILHYNLDHFNEAEQFLDRAVSQVQQVDDPYSELCALQVSSGVKWRLDKVDEARSYVEPAYQLALQSESPDWQLRCLTTMLNIYDRLQLADSAQLSLQRGNDLLPLLPAKSITSIGYLTARSAYYHAHQQWALAARDLETVIGSGTMTFELFDHLAICYEHLGQWEQAYRYKDSATVYSRLEADEEFSRQLADFNVRYQTIEKDLEISRLHEERARTNIIIVAAVLILDLLLLGLWLWRRQQLQRREAQLRIDTLEQERRRIAHELHDGLCNDLLALEMQCTADFKPDEAATRLCQLRQQTRTLSHQLMPPDFSHLSLVELLEAFARQTTKETGLRTSFVNNMLQPQPFSADVSHELYRITQEHIANIVKGKTATHVDISLTEKQLTIKDDGKPTSSADQQGIGQRTMNDRALSIGAHISNTQADGHNILAISFD
ncbi:MAG: tetratricopeptide repeat protein [Prevotella sp.]|nr:tetratricopeptide repeat protein [Prevotella sp.]